MSKKPTIPKSVTRYAKLDSPELYRWLSNLKKVYGNQPVGITITSEKSDSSRERDYFEGAVVPYFCYLMPIYNPKSTEDRKRVREMVKQWFIGETAPGLDGGTIKICPSSKGKIKELLDLANAWFIDNGYPIPDPALYKKWRDVFFCEYGDYWQWLEANHLNVDGTSRLESPLRPLYAYEPVS